MCLCAGILINRSGRCLSWVLQRCQPATEKKRKKKYTFVCVLKNLFIFAVLINKQKTKTMKKLILVLAVVTFIACLIAPLYLVLNGLPQNAEAWVISYVLFTGLSGGYITIFDIKS